MSYGVNYRHWSQDREATCYVGGLDERMTDALLWELMVQVGRVESVHLPKDRVTGNHSGFGFVEFKTEMDADYAAKVMNGVRLFGKPIRVNKASADKQKTIDIGANLYIGNLDAGVDEKMLYDIFSRFGTLVTPPKIARDDHNISKGYGFVSFSDFDASDDALNNMNGQFVMNREVSVQYAFKNNDRKERHGDAAERMLAANARKNNVAPAPQPLPPQFYGGNTPSGPAAMAGGEAHGGPRPSGPMPGYGNPGAAPSTGFTPPVPASGPHSRPSSAAPLPPPPTGLPSRPPPSQAGYGGPAGFIPANYNGPAPGGSPAGFAPPPPGFPAAGGQPGQGAAPPAGMPPGFQAPPGYGGRR
ncbi:hypothetical protein BDY21DRAFT_392300 [Lineolata rhizophorae]|uniref:RRM domain-containing protein n=1 Tax=Lineolata rhizophorae TaxID=578093 RepID=A0A6A6P0A3_9PEZI|nr:hypothetical protein BDY21DRAFT_392300 [Lineolata rhizophorae]